VADLVGTRAGGKTAVIAKRHAQCAPAFASLTTVFAISSMSAKSSFSAAMVAFVPVARLGAARIPAVALPEASSLISACVGRRLAL